MFNEQGYLAVLSNICWAAVHYILHPLQILIITACFVHHWRPAREFVYPPFADTLKEWLPLREIAPDDGLSTTLNAKQYWADAEVKVSRIHIGLSLSHSAVFKKTGQSIDYEDGRPPGWYPMLQTFKALQHIINCCFEGYNVLPNI